MSKFIYFLLIFAFTTTCVSNEKKISSYAEWPQNNLSENLKLKPTGKIPYSVGIFFVNDEFWSRVIASGDSKQIKNFEKEIVNSGFVSYVSIINKSKDLTVDEIRNSGAQLGVDAVLILEQDIDLKVNANLFSILYGTIVGIWLAPGHNINSLVTIKGSLWDSKSGYLILSIRGEGQDNSYSSLYSVLTKASISSSIGSATEKAVASLLEDIKDEIPKARLKISKIEK